MKKIFAVAAAAGMMAVLSACACWSPINEQCTTKVHKINTGIAPDALSINQVQVLPSRDVFRPSYTAGKKRITTIGNGFCRKQALKDAVAKLCIENDCDMIAAAKVIMIKTTHPRWIFFSYNTYQAHLTGLPLTMTGLNKELRKDPPKPVIVKQGLSQAEVAKLIAIAVKKQKADCQPALIQLKDIKLSMTASADTNSKIAVKLPSDCKTGK